MRFVLLALCFALPAAAQPWRYVDSRGGVHFTNNPNELPPALRAKAKARLEQKRQEAEAVAAAEAEAAAAAAAAAKAAGEDPEALPVVAVPSAEAPASAAPESKAPTARDIWQGKVAEAAKASVALDSELAEARVTAQEASRRAIITPSGQNSAQHAEALAKLAALEAEAQAARELLERTQAAQPR